MFINCSSYAYQLLVKVKLIRCEQYYYTLQSAWLPVCFTNKPMEICGVNQLICPIKGRLKQALNSHHHLVTDRKDALYKSKKEQTKSLILENSWCPDWWLIWLSNRALNILVGNGLLTGTPHEWLSCEHWLASETTELSWLGSQVWR